MHRSVVTRCREPLTESAKIVPANQRWQFKLKEQYPGSGRVGHDVEAPGPQVVPDAHVWNYGDIDRTCLRWTDGCVVCDRGTGFACTPQDRVLCLHRE